MTNTYRITDTEALREACIKNNWFTAGTNEQYEKLFYLNKNTASLGELATLIWVCSEDWSRENILHELRKIQWQYLAKLNDK